jgi:hypothetical protein
MVHVSMTAPESILKLQAIKSSRILGVCFWRAPIELNKKLEDIEEVGGMSTQLETSRQLEILLTLLLVLRFWNLG